MIDKPGSNRVVSILKLDLGVLQDRSPTRCLPPKHRSAIIRRILGPQRLVPARSRV